MNFQRIVILGGVLGGLAALVAGASTSGPSRTVVAPAPTSVAVELSGQELAAQISRLHERLRPDVPPMRPTRNLFRFSTARATTATASAPPSPERLAEPIVGAVSAPAPAWTLIGIAEDVGGDGRAVRTAILSGTGGLRLVKSGEALADGYRVREISDDGVELTAASGEAPAVRLALK